LTSTVQAKSDGNKGGGGKGNGKGGGGGAHVAQIAPHQQQRPGGGNLMRVQPNGLNRYNAAQARHNAPSVALTGRARPDSATAQQHVATRGQNWNERRNRIIKGLQWQQRYENRQERWEDRQDYWKERREDWEDHHHDYDWDHHYYVPFSVHRYWDHNRIYYWNNNPYRWYNNAWVIVGPGYDYGYDYAPGVEYYGREEYSGGGSVVARVQDRLAREGYDPGPIDGALGGRTRDAIIDFQKDHELPVTDGSIRHYSGS